MASTYYPSKCNGKDILIKSRCQCKKITIKKRGSKKVLKITVKKKVEKCSTLKKRNCKKIKKICNPITGRCKNKIVVKKTAKKRVKKTAKKRVKKTAKKRVKKTAKKRVKKTAKKRVKKTAKKRVKKTVKKCSTLKKHNCKKIKKICNPITGRCKNKIAKKRVKKKHAKKKVKKMSKQKRDLLEQNPAHMTPPKPNDLIIKNTTPKLAKELRKAQKTITNIYSPSINRQLMSLKSITPKGDIYDCPDGDIMITTKNGKKCSKWNSKNAKDVMLQNLNTTKPVVASEIMAPMQNQSNCWMNSFFVTWFISDGGRKFNRWFRQVAITGKLPNGTNIPSKFKRPAFLLNKMIDASLRGGNDPSRYAELMDTNEIIRSFHRAAPKSGIVKTRIASNPLSFYSTIYKAITGGTGKEINDFRYDSWVENGPLNWLNFVAQGNDTKETLQNHIRDNFKISHPKVLFIETFDSDARVKKHKILSFNENGKKISYKLDAAVLRNTTKIHFSAYVTINNVDYGFDGESYSRLEKFDWKNKLNKNTQWRFTERFETYFNFVKCYSMLIYYRIN
jgi:hypothetical protein